MSDLDILKEFLVESRENLDQLDRDLIVLEKEPTDRARLASIFRTIHTIKGTCGFLHFAKLEAVTHVGENLLSRLRDGRLLLNAEITNALLALVDAVREMLARIESTSQDGEENYTSLIALLGRLAGDSATEPVSPSPLVVSRSGEVCERETQAGVSDSTIRVDVGLMDKLMTLVGELVLARNQILQATATHTDATFVGTCQRLNLITTELQEAVMKTRMQPIANVWSKFPRVARDLALACGKQVHIDMEGKETELDKTLIEAIKDPLTHLLRNAIDHGIETPEKRRARGKADEGRVSLRAFHEGGHVNVEVADDGGGLDVEKIKHKALERALITPEQAARMNDRELLQLIFLPGFSTAEKITAVSGRGVGMDVVKTNIEKIGGTVDIQSEPEQSTTVKLKIPLTLAIIPALMVTSGDDRYAIPQVSLLELVRLEGENARRGIEMFHGTPVYRLRGNLLPVVYLNRLLQVNCQRSEPSASIVHIVVLQVDQHAFGLVVDGVSDTEEIVVKPLAQQLKTIPLFAGAAIMGDGRVALILDVFGIARSAGVIAEVHKRSLANKEVRTENFAESCQTLLLVELNPGHRLAIPLPLVTRLEEFPLRAVQKTAYGDVVWYRGQILPLIPLSAVLQGTVREPVNIPKDSLQVVVYSEGGRCVGLVVDHILDAIQTSTEVQYFAHRPGILGSMVLQQRVTDLLDLPGVLRAADPGSLNPLVAGKA